MRHSSSACFYPWYEAPLLSGLSFARDVRRRQGRGSGEVAGEVVGEGWGLGRQEE